MRIIARSTLRRFVASRAGHKDQPALKAALDAWFDEVRKRAGAARPTFGGFMRQRAS
jgi:mRNA interferase HigB